MHFQETGGGGGGGGGEKREKEEINKMEIWKVILKNWLLFYGTDRHKNRRAAVSAGSESQLAQYLASKNGQ